MLDFKFLWKLFFFFEQQFAIVHIHFIEWISMRLFVSEFSFSEAKKREPNRKEYLMRFNAL